MIAEIFTGDRAPTAVGITRSCSIPDTVLPGKTVNYFLRSLKPGIFPVLNALSMTKLQRAAALAPRARPWPPRRGRRGTILGRPAAVVHHAAISLKGKIFC
ncbi:hypothetical protein [Burkholderia glumae]|uniref:hypothetical protein n=1 Tax=Burkholderia glumae TaxID=337 RepID=UPI0012FA712C|nr:hypothetical protein [Burkholderia glumae]QHE12581.1 hypothetical protein GQR88_19675 [Burkholderia glumae AU6208]QJP70208.1 hypothetical protein HJC54_07845 [Burkholderia glumae]